MIIRKKIAQMRNLNKLAMEKDLMLMAL